MVLAHDLQAFLSLGISAGFVQLCIESGLLGRMTLLAGMTTEDDRRRCTSSAAAALR
jgi:hypothetical protein